MLGADTELPSVLLCIDSSPASKVSVSLSSTPPLEFGPSRTRAECLATRSATRAAIGSETDLANELGPGLGLGLKLVAALNGMDRHGSWRAASDPVVWVGERIGVEVATGGVQSGAAGECSDEEAAESMADVGRPADPAPIRAVPIASAAIASAPIASASRAAAPITAAPIASSRSDVGPVDEGPVAADSRAAKKLLAVPGIRSLSGGDCRAIPAVLREAPVP